MVLAQSVKLRLASGTRQLAIGINGRGRRRGAAAGITTEWARAYQMVAQIIIDGAEQSAAAA